MSKHTNIHTMKKIKLNIVSGSLSTEESQQIKKMLIERINIAFKGHKSFKVTDKIGQILHFKIGTKILGKKGMDYRMVKIDKSKN